MSQIINVKLETLKLAEKNVRLHPKKQIEEYKRSLNKFGQTKNAVIDEDNNVLIGNGLVIAARELGWKEIYAIKRTDLTENDKLKIMVSDNKVFGLGIDNLDVLDEIFEQLKGDLEIPGYDEETLNLMVAEATDISGEIASYGILPQNEVEAIRDRAEPTIYQNTETSIETDSVPNPTSEIMQESKENDENNPYHEREEHISESNDMVKLKCEECGKDLWLSKEQLRQLIS